MSDYKLTNDQSIFVQEAKEAGLTIDYAYSGRHMYGKKCPSVVVEDVHSFRSAAKGTQWDNLGLRYVLYCPDTF